MVKEPSVLGRCFFLWMFGRWLQALGETSGLGAIYELSPHSTDIFQASFLWAPDVYITKTASVNPGTRWLWCFLIWLESWYHSRGFGFCPVPRKGERWQQGLLLFHAIPATDQPDIISFNAETRTCLEMSCWKIRVWRFRNCFGCV